MRVEWEFRVTRHEIPENDDERAQGLALKHDERRLMAQRYLFGTRLSPHWIVSREVCEMFDRILESVAKAKERG